MAQTEVEILNIDTSKSVQSVGNLKAEIKELKNQLYGLEQGTVEYNEVLAELAEKQRKVAETSYRINEASTDFSNNVANLAGTIGGLSGAVSTVTGTLSLMGVQMGDDSKLMKTLVAAMSITSGVTAIEKGYTSLRHLTQGLKMATAGTKSLGAAMKALALSNPFTLILAAVTALISAIAVFSKKSKEAAENLEAVGNSAAALRDASIQDMFNDGIEAVTKYEQHVTKTYGKIVDDIIGYNKLLLQMSEVTARKEEEITEDSVNTIESILAKRRANELKGYEDDYKKYTQYLAQETDVSSDTYATWYKQQTEARQKIYAVNITYYQQEIKALNNYLTASADAMDAATREMVTQRIIELQRMVSEEAKAYNQSIAAYNEFENKKNKDADAAAQKRKAAAQKAADQRKADLQQIAKIEREAQLALMSEEDAALAKLKDAYDEQVKLYDKRGQDKTNLTAKYEKERQEIIDKYINERVQKDIETAEKEQERAENLSAALISILEKQLADEDILYDQLQTDSDNRLAKDYTEEKVLQAEEMMEAAYMALLERKIELEQQLLESEQLTDEDREALQETLLQHQKEKAEKSVEIERKALEKRKTLYKNYAKAVGTITSSISSILGSIGSTLEEGSNQWKMVKIAEATISTIQGGIAAYMGMVESIPGPAGIIAGAAAALATVTAGMIEVNKIRNTEISTSGAGGSTSTTSSLGNVRPQAVQVAATQVTNTRQTSTTSDIEELPDTKVYVLESDITNAQHNVKTTVEQATF